MASTRRPCPRRSRLVTSSHPLHRRETLRYTLLASIAWNYVLCVSLDSALGLEGRKVHVSCTTPRTSTAENTLNAVDVCICVHMHILYLGYRGNTSHCPGSLSRTSGTIQPPPRGPAPNNMHSDIFKLPCVTYCSLVHNEWSLVAPSEQLSCTGHYVIEPSSLE